MGQERFPRAGARHLRSRAANGKTPGRHDDRSATLSLDWDRSPSSNAWRMPRPRKRVLELSCGVGSLQQVPRWNAVRRARRVKARAASADADHRKTCAWRRSASFLFVEHDPEKWIPVFRKDHAQIIAEHDRAESRSHRRFRRDAILLSGFVDCLLRMILSE